MVHNRGLRPGPSARMGKERWRLCAVCWLCRAMLVRAVSWTAAEGGEADLMAEPMSVCLVGAAPGRNRTAARRGKKRARG